MAMDMDMGREGARFCLRWSDAFAVYGMGHRLGDGIFN